ncbi:MAG: hypothetical protein ACOX9E_06110 [Lentisphaeria bacterium]|jgi:hypothetical protein
MVKRLRRNMDIMDTMDDNTCPSAVHTVPARLGDMCSLTCLGELAFNERLYRALGRCYH